MRCQLCSEQNEAGATYCIRCGARFKDIQENGIIEEPRVDPWKYCSECGSILQLQAFQCTECKASQPFVPSNPRPLCTLGKGFNAQADFLNILNRGSTLLFVYLLGLILLLGVSFLFFFPVGNDLGFFSPNLVWIVSFFAAIVTFAGNFGVNDLSWCFDRIIPLKGRVFNQRTWKRLLMSGSLAFFFCSLVAAIIFIFPGTEEAIYDVYSTSTVLLTLLFSATFILTAVGIHHLGSDLTKLAKDVNSSWLRAAGIAYLTLFTSIAAPIFTMLGAGEVRHYFGSIQNELFHIRMEMDLGRKLPKTADISDRYTGEDSLYSIAKERDLEEFISDR